MQNKSNNTIQVLWVGMGSLSSFALAIVSAAILSRYFNKADYGSYRQILYLYSTLLVIFTAGLPRVFSYFLPRFNMQEGKYIVWKISKILFLFGAVFSSFLFIFSDSIAALLKNQELGSGLKIFSPIPMLLLPTLGIEGIFSTYKKTVYIAIYNTTTRILMLLFIVLPVIIFKGSYIYAIYGWLVVSFISLLMAIYFKGIPFKGIKAENANLSYKEIFAYSIPLATASLWGIAIKAADQFFISRYFGREVFAEFANGFIELPLVGMVTGATSIVLMPMFSKILHDKSDVSNIIFLWKRALFKSALIIYPLVCFFIFNARSVVELLYSSTYVKSTIYFQISMVLNFFNIIIFAPLLLAMGETRFYSKLHMFIAFTSWILGYIIVLTFHSPIAIAVFSVTLAILKVLIALKHSAKLINVHFFCLLPLRNCFAVILHSSFAAICIKLLMTQYLPQVDNLMAIFINFSGFLVILLFTEKLFNLNYLIVLEPFMGRFKKNVVQI